MYSIHLLTAASSGTACVTRVMNTAFSTQITVHKHLHDAIIVLGDAWFLSLSLMNMQNWCQPHSQARHKGQIEAAQMRALRRIKGVSRMDRVRNVDIRGRLKQEGVLDMVKKRQQNWKQKVEEMSNNRVTKKIYDGEIPGRRPRGRPRKRWSCNFD